MSVYSNETIAHRVAGFSRPKISLSDEIKAVLAGLAVGAVLLGVVAIHDVPDSGDVHTRTNVEDLRSNASGLDQALPRRLHY